MRRPAILVSLLLAAAAAAYLLLRSEADRPDGPTTIPTAPDAPTIPTTGDLAPAVAEAGAAQRRDATPEPGAPAARYAVSGTVLGEPNGPSVAGIKVLAYLGRPGDDASLFPGLQPGPGGMRTGPAFLLVGEPIAEAIADGAGHFAFTTAEPHLRLSIEHDFYLLAMPAMVHVPAAGRRDDVVLTPLLGGLLRGRVLGEGAADVSTVELRAEADPMSMLRDPQLFLGAMASMLGRKAPVDGGEFVFRGVLPGSKLTVVAQADAHCGRTAVPPLAPGVARDVVLAVQRGVQLEVQVVDDAGAPIDKAQVMVIPAAARGSMAPQVQARHGHTAADGIARFAALEPGRAQVEAMARARTAARAEIELAAGAASQPIRLTLGEGGVVTGRVLRPDGAPLAGAKVAHQPGENLPIVGNVADQLGPDFLAAVAEGGVPTDEQGAFRLTGLADDGTFLVVAAHPDFTANYAGGVRMGAAGVEIRLEPRADLVGAVVRDDDGAPLADFTVSLLRTAFLVLRMPVRSERIAAAADGRFRLAGVSPGSYTLRVEAEGFGSVERTVTVAKGDNDAGELRIRAAAFVRGVVQDGDGRPVARAHVRRRQGGMADNPMLTMFLGAAASTHTDAEGRFRLGPLQPGRVQLVASAHGHASGRSERVEVAPGQEVEGVVIMLTGGGSVRGRLLLGPGRFPDEFLLMAQDQATQNSHGADLAPDGSFEFLHLDPGQYVVQAMPEALMRGFDTSGWRPGEGMKLGEMMRSVTDNVVSQRCAVRDGEATEVTLDARELGEGALWTVRVQIGDEPLVEGLVEAHSAADGRVSVAMLEDGAATFGSLPAGIYGLQVRSGLSMAPVGGRQETVLPSGRDTHATTLRLPGGELRGRVVAATDGEPLAAALVRLFHDGHAERDDAIGHALTGPDGGFRFTGLAPGRYTLVAAEGPLGGTGSASRREGLEVRADGTAEPIELRAQPAASASAVVTTDGGAPIPGATLLVVDAEGRPLGALGLAVSGADGRAWFGGLPRGEARVVGRAPGFAPGVSDVGALADDGSTEFRLALPRGARTTVQAFDRDGRQLRGATLTARWNGGPWLPAILLEEGRSGEGAIELGRLGPGDWLFRVSHPAFGTQEQRRTIGSEPSVTVVIAPR